MKLGANTSSTGRYPATDAFDRVVYVFWIPSFVPHSCFWRLSLSPLNLRIPRHRQTKVSRSTAPTHTQNIPDGEGGLDL